MLTREGETFNLALETLVRFPPTGDVFHRNTRMNYVTVYSLIRIYGFHSVLLKCTPQRQML